MRARHVLLAILIIAVGMTITAARRGAFTEWSAKARHFSVALLGFPFYPLVDLEVTDASLPDAVKRLSQASGVSIVVDESVPEGIKVSGQVHGVPLGRALSMLLDQANLTYTVQQSRHRRTEIRIVPRPQLQVDTTRSRPPRTEIVTALPLIWRAKPDPDSRGFTERWYAPDFDDSAWPTVTIARMWHAQEGPLKGLTGSYAWGRVRFLVDPVWRGRRVVLRIVALDEEGTVYLNGKQVAGPGALAVEWQRPLDIDVSDKLHFDRPNVLVVCAYARSTVGGVYRPVILYARPKD